MLNQLFFGLLSHNSGDLSELCSFYCSDCFVVFIEAWNSRVVMQDRFVNFSLFVENYGIFIYFEEFSNEMAI